MSVTSVSSTNRQWLLRTCPSGPIGQDDFELRSGPRAEPADGEIVLRVHYLAMDPAIRGFMNQSGGYAAPIAPGTPVRGMVLGEVVESRADAMPVGETVWGFASWSDYVVAPAGQFHHAAGRQAAGPDLLHRRGTIGLTAHYGLTRIAQMRPGETILVSGAAGAVGSLVGQMARNLGAGRIVGIAGGAAKCRRAVERYGYDLCLDYKAGTDLRGALMAAAPGGFDVYFDNVGGPLLALAIDLIRKNARIALCGMIAGYDGAGASPPPNLWNLVVQTAMIRGFRVAEILNDHALVVEAQDEIEGWIANGRLHGDLDIRTGLENAPATFLTLFSGGNHGRLLVHVNEDGW